MNILFMSDRYAPSLGGIEQQCQILAHKISASGMNVYILTEKYDPSLKTHEYEGNIHIYRIGSLSVVRLMLQRYVIYLKHKMQPAGERRTFATNKYAYDWIYSLSRNIYRMLLYKIPVMCFALTSFFILWRKRNMYDVIQVFQTQWLAFVAVLAGRLFNKPVVVREEGYLAIDALDNFFFGSFAKKVIIRNATFIALSKVIQKNFIERAVQPDRIVLIHNCVESEIYPKPEMNNPISVLFVGNVLNDPLQKGLDILLNAWQCVVAVMPAARLNIVGVGDFTEFKTMTQRFHITQSVTFSGASTQISALYRSHNIFVLPSRYEGMSIALLEAMAFRRACVVTAVSGSDDLIINKKTGIKVPIENAQALAEGLIYMLEHSEEAVQMGLAAYEHVKKHYDPKSIAQQYQTVYSTLLKPDYNHTSIGTHSK